MSPEGAPGANDLASVMELVADVDGWMTPGQASTLLDAARRCPPAGSIVEIGSFRGRSTIVLASGAPREDADRRHRPARGQRSWTAGDRGVSGRSERRPRGVPRQPRTSRCRRPGASPAHVLRRGAGARRRAGRRALHRRGAPLRTSARRHPFVGRSCRRRWHDADPRLVLVHRCDGGDSPGPAARVEVPICRTLTLHDDLPRRPRRRASAHGWPTPPGRSPSSRGSSRTSGSR